MRYFWLAAMALVLTSCTHYAEDKAAINQRAEEDSRQVGNNIRHRTMRMADSVRDNLKQSGDKLREWWITPPPAQMPNKPVKASYCYHVLQDIVCYRQPMPGWEHRVAGYQGTGAPPPAPAMMEPPPFADAPEKLPVNRLANVEPVFKDIPPPLETRKTEIDPNNPELMVDPAHETLPNPAYAPQL